MATTNILSFRDLDAWKVAMDLAVVAHHISKRLPPSERYEMASQIRRAANSIAANIAEGQSCGRGGRYVSHVKIALGSHGELSTHLELACRLEFLTLADLKSLDDHLARTGQLLHGLLRSLRRQRLEKAWKGLAFFGGLLLGASVFAALRHSLPVPLLSQILARPLSADDLVLSWIDVDVFAHLLNLWLGL